MGVEVASLAIFFHLRLVESKHCLPLSKSYWFQLVTKIKERLPGKVPSTWLSEHFLVRCIERKKGGEVAGTVASYRDMWGRQGIQEVDFTID